MSKPNDAPFVPTVTDELAAAVTMLLSAADKHHEMHGMVNLDTAIHVAKLAMEHYAQQKESKGNNS